MSVFLFADVSIGSSEDIVGEFATSQLGLALFVIIAAASIFGQLYIVSIVNQKINENSTNKPHRFGKFESVTRISQYILAGIMVIIILQIILTKEYYTDLLTSALAISYGLVAYLSSLLAYKFISWYRINRSLIVILYGIAATLIVANAVDTILLFAPQLIDKPDVITAASEVVYEGNFEPGHPLYIQSLVMAITQTGYFLLIWGATVLLLYHNIKRLGKLKFWCLVVPPILFFMSFYISFYETLNPPDPEKVPPLIVYILLVIYSMIAAGVFFGAGFLSIARSRGMQGNIKDYMLLTGYSFILFIMSSISVIHQAAFPPFGLASVNAVGMASFLMLSGLYRSAVTVSEDIQLRRSIKSTAKEESRLIDSIGSAEMHSEISKKVIAITKRNIETLALESGVAPSLSDQEITDYVEQAARELKQRRDEHRPLDDNVAEEKK